MINLRFAEKANYWMTTIYPAKSQAAIIKLLEDFGAMSYQIMQGKVGGRYAWLVRFDWKGKSYRFVFTPIECENPEKQSSFNKKRRTHEAQAKYQMGRIAAHFVKAILTAAESHPHALFGFTEIPDTARGGALPMTAGELDTSGIVSALPPLPGDTFLLTNGGASDE